jgi:hypothetical protein
MLRHAVLGVQEWRDVQHLLLPSTLEHSEHTARATGALLQVLEAQQLHMQPR